MEWRDDGIVIGILKHGETAVILEAFTRARGRHRGFVHGGAGRRRRGMLQPGNVLSLGWRGRAPDSLGTFTAEMKTAHAASVMSLAGPLCALRAVLGILARTLPDQDPHPGLYDKLLDLLAALGAHRGDDPAWAVAAARFERDLLADLGYGLDLGSCAVTGAADGLAYVSPRTGRAVTAEGAGRHRDRLLPLPAFLIGRGPAEWEDVAAALRLTGHFLERCIAESGGRAMPAERHRLAAMVMQRMDAAPLSR